MNCDRELGDRNYFMVLWSCFVLLHLIKTIPNPCFMYASRLLRSFSDVCLKSELKANSLPSDQKDDSEDYSDIIRVRGESMLEQNPVILLPLWIIMTHVSCFGIKKKLIYCMFVNLGLDSTLLECWHTFVRSSLRIFPCLTVLREASPVVYENWSGFSY
jgi:hypothetical protein